MVLPVPILAVIAGVPRSSHRHQQIAADGIRSGLRKRLVYGASSVAGWKLGECAGTHGDQRLW